MEGEIHQRERNQRLYDFLGFGKQLKIILSQDHQWEQMLCRDKERCTQALFPTTLSQKKEWQIGAAASLGSYFPWQTSQAAEAQPGSPEHPDRPCRKSGNTC